MCLKLNHDKYHPKLMRNGIQMVSKGLRRVGSKLTWLVKTIVTTLHPEKILILNLYQYVESRNRLPKPQN